MSVTTQYTFDEADTLVANLKQTLNDWGDDMDDKEVELLEDFIASLENKDIIKFSEEV